jgi:hypothetical protein
VAVGCGEARWNSEIFPFSLDLIKWSSNQIQFESKSVQICSNMVPEWFGLKFMNSNRESELGFQIPLNLI